jgi:hypothetical protein
MRIRRITENRTPITSLAWWRCIASRNRQIEFAANTTRARHVTSSTPIRAIAADASATPLLRPALEHV